MKTTEICGLPAQSMLILCGELLSTMGDEKLWIDTLEDWGICEDFPAADREILAEEFDKWKREIDPEPEDLEFTPFEEITVTCWMLFLSDRIEKEFPAVENGATK